MSSSDDPANSAQSAGESAEDGLLAFDEGADIDEGLFELILKKDLANIVKKVRAGQSLTTRERDLLESERSRRQKPDEAGDFQLECVAADNALAQMRQAELAKAWGYSPRQLKNWLAEGRRLGDPAPVKEPAKMQEWFQRVYAPRACPEKLRLAALRLLDGQKPVPAPAAPAPPPRIEIADGQKGLLAMLDRYRTAEAELHQKYMAAIEAGNETLASFLLTEWGKMGDKLRALEKTAPRALEELGIYVRRDDIQRELEPLHSAIMKSFRQEFRLARPRLKATTTQAEWARLVDELVEKVALILVETEFAEPLELQVA